MLDADTQRIDVPVGGQRLTRMKRGKSPVDKGAEIGPADLVGHLAVDRHRSHELFLLSDLSRRGPKRRRMKGNIEPASVPKRTTPIRLNANVSRAM